MNVKKEDGRIVPFDPAKVIESIKRTGAGDEVAEKVLNAVRSKMTDGMTTAKLYHLVRAELDKQNICFACRYGLREGILKLGPAGYNFEYYIAAILRAYGYEATNPQRDIEGSCVAHEVDVIGEKDGKRIFIEAKFRNRRSDNVNLKDIMATWSRFVDLVDGGSMGKNPGFDECHVMTNARFSDRALAFGECKGMKLTGWSYPKEGAFNELVDRVEFYPVTVIEDMSKTELEHFAKAGLILCKDIEGLEPEELADRTDISVHRAEELIGLCTKVIEG